MDNVTWDDAIMQEEIFGPLFLAVQPSAVSIKLTYQLYVMRSTAVFFKKLA